MAGFKRIWSKLNKVVLFCCFTEIKGDGKSLFYRIESSQQSWNAAITTPFYQWGNWRRSLSYMSKLIQLGGFKTGIEVCLEQTISVLRTLRHRNSQTVMKCSQRVDCGENLPHCRGFPLERPSSSSPEGTAVWEHRKECFSPVSLTLLYIITPS